jgi:hypothetical protein
MDKIQEKTAEIKASATGLVGGFPPIPTTKILAIGRFLAPLTPEQRKATLPREVPETVRLYLGGKIAPNKSRAARLQSLAISLIRKFLFSE